MDELVEILTEDGIFTGRSVNKIDSHRHGICHGISVIAVINNNGELLIQKRAASKKDEPNKWDLSGAGHIDMGETPQETAIRELNEELGIKLDSSELELVDAYLNKYDLDNGMHISHFVYLFIARKEIDISCVSLQENEVSEVMFVSKDRYLELYNNGYMVKGIAKADKVLKYVR